MILSPRFTLLLFVLLVIALTGAAVIFVFWKKLYSRLSARITVLILASGLAALTTYLVSDELLNDRGPSRWVSAIQLTLLILGGPGLLGLFVARFIRRPLRQFKEAVASLEQSNYKVQIPPMGIREFDEVFTKFNSLTKRLHQEEKLRKDLVSDTSHELNTPLTTMIGQLTALQEGKYPLTKERVSLVKEQAERLAELVKQLDAYTKARLPGGGKRENVPLKQLCDELVHHFSIELKQKGITVKLRIPEDYIVQSNSGVLQQIFTNLMQNTLRYSQATEITIQAEPHKISFLDNGKGVPDKSLPHLFERFYRVDRSRNRSTGGLGLGLAIVRELVESQGWVISVGPARPGLIFVLKI